MKPDLEERALSIVLQLSEAPQDERDGLQSRLCGDDPQLKSAVADLWQIHQGVERKDFWQRPVTLSPDSPSENAAGVRATDGSETDRLKRPPKLERFIPIDILGLGGQGEVWLMLDPRIDRRVALKIVQPSQKGSKATLSSFRREAEISGKLEHPNIVPVYDITAELSEAGDADINSPCFVMRVFGDPRLHLAIEAYHQRPRKETDRGLLDALRAYDRTQTPENRQALEHELAGFSVDEEQPADAALKSAIESILRDDSDAGTLTKAIHRLHTGEWSELQLRKLLGRFQRVCEGVAYAHSRGVIHRDLKPDNIMLGEYGETLVADWGLAKVVGRQDLDNDRATEGTLEISSENSGDGATRLGDLKGTPRYMSPEQALGRNDELTHATDIYSLGAILYRILTGRDAIDCQLLKDVLQQVRDCEFQSPRAVLPRIPRALEAIVLKAMSRKPADRYASALALSADIENWLNDEPVSACREPLTVRVRRWIKWHQAAVVASVATLSVALISLGLVALIVSRHNVELSESNSQLSVAKKDADDQRAEAFNNAETARKNEQLATAREQEVGQLLVNSNLARGEEAVANGDFLLARQAYAQSLLTAETRVKSSGEDLKILRIRLAMLESVAPQLQQTVFSAAPIRQAEFSPSGEVLAIRQMSNIKLVESASGRTLIEGFEHDWPLDGFSFSPDGKKLASWTGVSIRLWNAESGELLTESATEGISVRRLIFSPDATKIGVVRHHGSSFSGQIELLNAENLALEGKAMKTSFAATSIAFSPDSSLVAATVGLKSVVIYKTTDQTLLCENAELPRGIFWDIAFSPNGMQVCAASEEGIAVVFDSQTARLVASLVHTEQPIAPAPHSRLAMARFSPDGQFIVTACGDRTVRLWKAATGQAVGQTMSHQDHVTACCFSPDGSLIGTSCLDGTARLWNVRSGNTTAAILRHAGPVHTIQIPSTDSILTAGEDRMARIWSFHPPEPLTLADGVPPTMSVISGDGGWIAGSVDGSAFRIWNAVDMKPAGSVILCKHRVHLMALTNNGSRLALSGWTKNEQASFAELPSGGLIVTSVPKSLLSVIESSTGQFIEDSIEIPGSPRRVLFNSDGCWCAVLSWTEQAGQLLTVRDLKNHRSISVDLSNPVEMIWNPDVNSELIVGCQDGRVHRLRFPDATPMYTGVDTGSEYSLEHLGTSNDGRLLITTSGTSIGTEVRVWGTTNRQPVSRALTGEDRATGAAFSSNGKKLLTWGGDGVVKVWTRQPNDLDWAETGQITHRGAVNDASFSPDGRLIATASDDRTANVWDSVSLRSVSPSLLHYIQSVGELEVQTVVFSTDGKTLYTTSSQPYMRESIGQTWRWPLTAVDDDSAELVSLSEFKNGLRLDKSGSWRRLTAEEQFEVLNQVADLLPYTWAARQHLGRHAKELHNLSEAERQYSLALKIEQNDGLLWFEYALVLHHLYKFQPALDAVTKAMSLGCSDGRVHLVRGRSLLHLDRFEESMQELTKAEETSLVPRVPQYARMDLANCQAMLGRFDDAASSLELSFREHRKFGEEVKAVDRYCQIVLALARNKPEEFKKLLQSYTKANLKTESISTAFHIALAAILRADSVEDWSLVIKLADQVAAEDPQNVTFQALPGYARYRAGQFPDAERLIKAAIGLQPPADPSREAASPLPHYFLALCLQARNQPGAAREAITAGNRLLDNLKAGPASVPIYIRLPWHRRTIFELLKAEAESVVPAKNP